MSDPTSIPALEKNILYTKFQKTFISYRMSQIPHAPFDMTQSGFELPNNSTLLTMNHFLSYEPSDHVEPDLTLPFITHEHLPIYFQSYMQIASSESQPFAVFDRYTFMQGRVRSQIQEFYNKHHQIHRVISRASVSRMNNILLWVDYAPLHKMRVTGRYAEYRKFDIIFRTILDDLISDTSARHKFLVIPVSDKIITRSAVSIAARKIDAQTMRYTDPSLLFLLDMLSMALGHVSSLTVTPPAADLTFWQHHPIHPSDGVETTTIPSAHGPLIIPKLKSTSLLDRVPTAAADLINIVLTHGTHATILNLGDLQHFSTEPTFFLRLLRHINLLKLSDAINHDELHQMDPEQLDQYTEDLAKTQQAQTEEPEEHPSSVTTKNVVVDPIKTSVVKTKGPIADHPTSTPLTPHPIPTLPSRAETKPPIDYTKHIANHLQATLSHDPRVDHIHIQRSNTLLTQHLNVRLGGKSIGEHLDFHPVKEINQNQLDFLAQTLPDPSMQNSTIADFDQNYIQNHHLKDLAHTLTSFVQHGLFVTDIKEDKIQDRFNRLTVYKVKLVDYHGRQHNLTFKLPDVDHNGQMLVNGVKQRMVKQQINLPLCKIGAGRVNLSSNYNKFLVERTKTVANDFSVFIVRYINRLKRDDLVDVKYAHFKIDETPLPYEYSVIAQTYSSMSMKGYEFHFDYPNRKDNLSSLTAERLKQLESFYGVFCGFDPQKNILFWDMKDAIHTVDHEDHHVSTSIHILDLLFTLFKDEVDPPTMVYEYATLKMLNKNFPVVFVLGYQFGLKAMLDYLKMDYKFYAKDTLLPASQIGDLSIEFQDGVLIFSRYPLNKSLIFAGLDWLNLKTYQFADLSVKDTYYQLCLDKGLSPNLLKGITNLFDFFLDPITIDVLQRMGEPLNVRDLLIKAVQMLATLDHYPSASMRHHRLRGYERFSSILYNEVAREYANYRNTDRLRTKPFSINPEAVFQRIMQDNTVQQVDIVNPIHDFKMTSNFTFGGAGGRSARAFVVNDRQYPQDAVGFMSEATPDSSKVAMTVYTTVDPKISNIRGMPIFSTHDQTPVTPTQMVSVTGVLMPSVTEDDKFVSDCKSLITV